MAKVKSMTERMDKFAKEAKGGAPVEESREEKMLNTRVTPAMLKRIKIACAYTDKTMRELINEALEEKLKALGY